MHCFPIYMANKRAIMLAELMYLNILSAQVVCNMMHFERANHLGDSRNVIVAAAYEAYQRLPCVLV